jgi:hypothetical protein
MGDWGWRRIDAEAAWHILIPACSKSAKGAIQMDHSSPHRPVLGSAHRSAHAGHTAKRGGA